MRFPRFFSLPPDHATCGSDEVVLHQLDALAVRAFAKCDAHGDRAATIRRFDREVLGLVSDLHSHAAQMIDRCIEARGAKSDVKNRAKRCGILIKVFENFDVVAITYIEHRGSLRRDIPRYFFRAAEAFDEKF